MSAMFSQSSNALIPSTTAVITNSGSTNTIGYRIYVAPSGAVNYVTGIGAGHNRIPRSLTTKFFRDIRAAMPLSQLPTIACLKSASFGTSTFITFGRERSPDVSCAGRDSRTLILNRDVYAIVKTLSIGNVPKSQGKALPPQNF